MHSLPSPQWVDAQLRQAHDLTTVDRILLIIALRDMPDAPSALLARIVAIPESRARFWKEVYFKSGPNGLLRTAHRTRDRHAPPISATDSATILDDLQDSRSLLLTLSRFYESLPGTDVPNWTTVMKESLRILKPNSHRASLAIRTSADLSSGKEEGNIRAMNQVVGEAEVSATSSIPFTYMWKLHLFEAVQKRHISFGTYSFPIARDCQDPLTGEKIGAVYFFRELRSRSFAKADHDAVDFYQPFLTNILLSRIILIQERNSLAASFPTLLPTLFPEEKKLTSAEEPVALHLILGRSDRSIADSLHLEISTVRSHVQKILKKSGCSTRNELMGKVLTRYMRSSDQPTGK